MKKTVSPLLRIGLLVLVAYIIIDKFVTPISNWIAIPILLVSIILIMTGGLKAKEKN